jgi:ethanolamine ammonia-lyase large subunit
MYKTVVSRKTYQFKNLKVLMAKATPLRSGDILAGVAANTQEERVAAQMALAEVPLKRFLEEELIPYEKDEVTRLILDSHNKEAFQSIANLTVGEFREYLLSENTTTEILQKIKDGITPEMAAAVSKIMRNQDLISVSKKCEVITKFRNTIGLHGRLSTRLQPNHPTDDLKGIAASVIDGLLLGSGDAVIGINPATDNVHNAIELLKMLDGVREKYKIPTQSCVLTHVTNTIEAIQKKAPS